MEAAPILEKLAEEGWNLNAAGLNAVTDNGTTTEVKQIVRRLLDVDLKSVSQGSVPDDFTKTKYETLPGGIVLQVQKVKNLSSPKYKETHHNSPSSILKFVLTDGVQNVQGIAIEPIPSLTVNTYPGSKIILIGEIEIAHGFLLLNQENTSFIGGRVDHMIDKWELNRSLAKHKRDNQEEGGPPPWIPFGQKISKQVVTDKNFKSLDQGKNKEGQENSEFEAQRKGAIMEACKIGTPKVFGGGNNKLLDHNVQIIVGAGFSVEQAEYALKLCKNNPDRALRSLQTKATKANSGETAGKGKPEEKGKGGKGRRHRDDETVASLKPSGKVSLFDFLEDKLPTSADKDVVIPALDTRAASEKRFNKISKPSGEDRKGSIERPEGKNSIRKTDSVKSVLNDKRSYQDKKSDTIRFETKKTYDAQRNDKSFGNFKVKNDYPKHDSGKQVRVYEKRENSSRTGPTSSKNYYNKNDKGFDGGHVHEDTGNSTRKSTFTSNCEKPPRFQKFQQSQQSESQVPHWNDTNNYPRIPQQTDFQLQNSLANLTIQQNVANYANQNSHEFVGGPPNGNKNLFYQNMVIPTTQNSETHRPPPSQHVPVSSYPSRNPAGFLQPELKPSTFPGLPNVPDYPFKGMPGFNDFQTVFGRATNTAYTANSYENSQSNYSNTQNAYNSAQNAYNNASPYSNTPNAYNSAQNTYNNAQNNFSHPQSTQNNMNNYNSAAGSLNSCNSTAPPFLSPPHMLQAAPPPVQTQAGAVPQARRWTWKKGQKCFARYWEDQQFYCAVVTGVSERTCVVRFTEYGNYEEVLQDDCLPVTDVHPDS